MSLNHALLSLDGLSTGDGFGELFFSRHLDKLEHRELPPGPWRWTDDTQMALSIVEVLREYERIEQDALARSFAQRYVDAPHRGYGGGAHRLLGALARGGEWREIAPGLFPGGSYGNGAAMRAAPIGGFFAGDPQQAAEHAARSAEITHAHPEGQAGAMAVAAAAALAAGEEVPRGQEFLHLVMSFLPNTQTRRSIDQARAIPPTGHETAVNQLGTGQQVSAQDTVPFCLWVAAYNLVDFEDAMWATVAGLGDRDTTCAIVGGIVALSAGGVPDEWLRRREPLPVDFFAR